MDFAERQTGNRAIAAALLRELCCGSDIRAALSVAREAAPLFGEADAWMPEESLAALLGNAKVDRSLGRRVGQSLMRSTEASLLMRYGGIANPEKAYRRCNELLAREVADGRYVVVRNESGASRIVFHTDLAEPVDGAFCGIRVGMLEAIPTLFGLLPAGVEETHCTERGDSCCVYEVRYRRGSFVGLSLGSVLGMGAGLGLALFAGAAPLAMGLFVFLGAVLAGAAGRAVDLARQLDAVGGARRGQLAVADHLDSLLAEKMDRFARLDILDRSVHGSQSVPGVPQTSRENHDLVAVVRAAINEHASRLPEGLEIDLDLPAEEVALECEALQIEMLVVALLRNVQVELGRSVRATVSVRAVPGGAELGVEDDGFGLENERADEAFDPFLGEETASEEDHESGLRTACRIVEDHGGELRIESAAGRGNRVTALLLGGPPR